MTTKEKINSALFGVAIVGAIICFVIGDKASGVALLMFAGGHSIKSPFGAKDGAEPE